MLENSQYDFSLRWRIQDFPEEEGAQTPKLELFCNFFCRKLHENERIWTPGAYVPGVPLASANGLIITIHNFRF